ncbi:MAG: S26 family signal peptidase [Candidatus Poseidoniales archaeon]|jgi:nickel-type superoxide dismutase maturation protease
MGSRFLNVVVKGNSMWPTLSDGITVRFEKITKDEIKEGQIVLTNHPLKNNHLIIKRVQSISNDRVFLVGDNPDPNESSDSHNFGTIPISEIIAISHMCQINI